MAHELPNTLLFAMAASSKPGSMIISADEAKERGFRQIEDPFHTIRGAKSKCAELRKIAKDWNQGRQAFIAGAVAYGINKATAATQYQKGRQIA